MNGKGRHEFVTRPAGHNRLAVYCSCGGWTWYRYLHPGGLKTSKFQGPNWGMTEQLREKLPAYKLLDFSWRRAYEGFCRHTFERE